MRVSGVDITTTHQNERTMDAHVSQQVDYSAVTTPSSSWHDESHDL